MPANSSQRIELIRGFKQNTQELISQIIAFAKEGNPKLRKYLSETDEGRATITKLSALKSVLDSLPGGDMLRKFCSEIEVREPGEKYNIRQMIKSHNMNYFLKSKHVMGLADDEKMRSLILQGIKYMDSEEIQVLWDYMDVYLEIAKEYN